MFFAVYVYMCICVTVFSVIHFIIIVILFSPKPKEEDGTLFWSTQTFRNSLQQPTVQEIWKLKYIFGLSLLPTMCFIIYKKSVMAVMTLSWSLLCFLYDMFNIGNMDGTVRKSVAIFKWPTLSCPLLTIIRRSSFSTVDYRNIKLTFAVFAIISPELQSLKFGRRPTQTLG